MPSQAQFQSAHGFIRHAFQELNESVFVNGRRQTSPLCVKMFLFSTGRRIAEMEVYLLLCKVSYTYLFKRECGGSIGDRATKWLALAFRSGDSVVQDPFRPLVEYDPGSTSRLHL